MSTPSAVRSDDASTGVRRPLPLRAVFGAVLAGGVLWWLFVADTAADNDVGAGIGDLFSGIGALPGLLTDTAGYRSLWNFMFEREGLGTILGRVVEHSQLVLTSMLFAVAISVVLGIVAHRVRVLAPAIVGVSSILLTIPSLALFAILISVDGIGIGDRGPLIALTLYSILPILRNTVTGLDDVDSAVVESAKGIGLSPVQRLVRIELPLAWPVILTGIRVATLLNIGIAAIAKLVGGSGLGTYINEGLTRYPQITSVERMWTGVVWTVVLALAFDLVFGLIRILTTPKGIR